MIAKTVTRNSLIVFVENVFANQATLEMEKPAFLLCLVSVMHVLVSDLYIYLERELESRK
jgi:hypothetical protein